MRYSILRTHTHQTKRSTHPHTWWIPHRHTYTLSSHAWTHKQGRRDTFVTRFSFRIFRQFYKYVCENVLWCCCFIHINRQTYTHNEKTTQILVPTCRVTQMPRHGQQLNTYLDAKRILFSQNRECSMPITNGTNERYLIHHCTCDTGGGRRGGGALMSGLIRISGLSKRNIVTVARNVRSTSRQFESNMHIRNQRDTVNCKI